jgi:hypothetical protein
VQCHTCTYDVWQDSKYKTGTFIVLHVDIDVVRLSKFIETNLNCQYEDGKAFYEVMENEEATEDEEDLLYCKKILHPNKEEVLVGHTHLYMLFLPLLHEVAKLNFHFILCSSVGRNWNCSHSLNISMLFPECHPWQSNQSS